MKGHASRSTAVASLLLLAGVSMIAETRPRYGGTLRVQLAGPLPAFHPADGRASLRDRSLIHLVAETLTRLNVRGEAEPLLATSWQSEMDNKRWRFTLRPRVLFHDGTPLTPAVAAAALKVVLKFEVVPTRTGVQVTAAEPTPEMPLLLALPAASIVREGSPLVGTGPFQLTQAAAGRTVLTAFEQHWAGRPFVDSIEFLPARTGTALLTAAELWEVPVGASRRSVPEGIQTWSSSTAELLAIDTGETDPAIAAALSASIDRESMATVLTQRRAEAAAAFLPQWISGYAFVFPAARDLSRAQALVQNLRLAPLGLTHEPGDSLERIVAERVAVNARDAGIVLSTRPAPGSQLRIRRFAMAPNAALALRGIAAEIGMGDHVRFGLSTDPDLSYGAERILLEAGKLVPLMHVPLVFGLHPKVRGWQQTDYTLPVLPLESVWIAP